MAIQFPHLFSLSVNFELKLNENTQMLKCIIIQCIPVCIIHVGTVQNCTFIFHNHLNDIKMINQQVGCETVGIWNVLLRFTQHFSKIMSSDLELLCAKTNAGGGGGGDFENDMDVEQTTSAAKSDHYTSTSVSFLNL